MVDSEHRAELVTSCDADRLRGVRRVNPIFSEAAEVVGKAAAAARDE